MSGEDARDGCPPRVMETLPQEINVGLSAGLGVELVPISASDEL